MEAFFIILAVVVFNVVACCFVYKLGYQRGRYDAFGEALNMHDQQESFHDLDDW